MKKILILNPPSPDNSYINRDQMGGMGQKIDFGTSLTSRLLSRLKSNMIHLPVVQLVYAATILSRNFDVKVIDALNEDKSLKGVMPEIQKFKPDFVITSVSSSCLLYERDVVARKIKDSVPGCVIITVGDTLSNMPDQLKQPFDIAVEDELEPVIARICSGENLKNIPGIIYLKGKKLIKNKKKERSMAKELDSLPFPRWDIFPYKRYRYYPLLMVKPVATLLSSRGCPYGCGYCPYTSNQGRIWRARSAENIVSEIEQDIRLYGFNGIAIRDPLFTLDNRRIEEMCALITKRKIKLNYAFETRPELLTESLLDKLYESGCRAINVGIEDIHPHILKGIRRPPVDIKKVMRIVSHAEKIGIRTTCFFILGLPGSTLETIKETIKFALKLNPSHAEFKIATPYPGTYLYELAKKNKWLVREEFDKLGGYSSTMKISDELSPSILERLSSDAFRKFYYRPKYILREILRGNILKKALIVLFS